MGTSNTLPGNPNAINPPPWQSPIGSVRLPDGSLAPVVMSEAWIMYFLQQREQTNDSGGGDSLSVALSALPNRTARSSSELAAAVALLQQSIAAQARIARLESELGALAALMQSLTANAVRMVPTAAANDLAALAFVNSSRKSPQIPLANGFMFSQGTYAAIPDPTYLADGQALYYATDKELFYVVESAAWVQAMAFISYNNGTNTITFTGSAILAGTHAQNVGTGDSPTFVDLDITGGAGYASLATELASLQAQITTISNGLTALKSDYDAHEHTAGTLTAPLGGGAVTGKTGTTDTPD